MPETFTETLRTVALQVGVPALASVRDGPGGPHRRGAGELLQEPAT